MSKMTKQETEAIDRNYIEQMFSHYTSNAWDGTLFVINGNQVCSLVLNTMWWTNTVEAHAAFALYGKAGANTDLRHGSMSNAPAGPVHGPVTS
jgi:hypothetical protein